VALKAGAAFADGPLACATPGRDLLQTRGFFFANVQITRYFAGRSPSRRSLDLAAFAVAREEPV
jgi:hypothetical protein